MKPLILALALMAAASAPAGALEFSANDINTATFDGQGLPKGQNPLTVRVQVLLDRAGASPGVIDGIAGGNVEKAIFGFEAINGLPQDGRLDTDVWSLLQQNAGDAIVPYTITTDDVSGLSKPLPRDYAELAKLDKLGYTSVVEKLAEKFHMDEDFLVALNSGKAMTAGTEIMVTDPGVPLEKPVARLIADKGRKWLVAYDSEDYVVAVYPVTIGSQSTPSPTGTHTVEGVAIDPTYTYNPKLNFQQGSNDKILTLPPGPNGPVGNVWIDLSKPTYGIHGSPNPALIDKTVSHGCVRLTNWDAHELAKLVKAGVPVEFR